MIIRTLAASAALALAIPAHAVVGVTLQRDSFGLDSFEYVQDFDTLAATSGTATVAWANDTTIDGWSLFDANKVGKTTYRASHGSDSSGTFYSYGANGVGERALGAVGAGTTYWGSPASSGLSGYIALALRNDAGIALEGIGVYWDAEQWRLGQDNQTTDAVDFRYGFGDTFATVTTWINPGASFKYNSPILNTAGGAGAALDGNANAIALGGDIALDWQAGQTLWLTWIDYNSAGNDHGVAIDNVFVTAALAPVPEPSTIALMVAGLGLVGLGAARRPHRS